MWRRHCYLKTHGHELQSIYQIDHTPYIVDFRSARKLPYDHRSVANTDTCSAPNKQGRACFFSVWRPVWTASALDNWQSRYSAPKMEDAIIRSAPWCWLVCVVRYDVAPYLSSPLILFTQLFRVTNKVASYIWGSGCLLIHIYDYKKIHLKPSSIATYWLLYIYIHVFIIYRCMNSSTKVRMYTNEGTYI